MPVSNFSSLSCCWTSILLMFLLTFPSVLFLQFLSQNHHQTWEILCVLSLSYSSLPSDSSFCTCGISVHMQDTLLVCEFFCPQNLHSFPSMVWVDPFLFPFFFETQDRIGLNYLLVFLMFPWVTTPDTVKPVYNDHLGDKVSAVFVDKWSLWRRPVYNGQNC